MLLRIDGAFQLLFVLSLVVAFVLVLDPYLKANEVFSD